MKATILIVDDEPGVRTALSGVLADEGYAVESVASGEACLDRLTRGPVDLILWTSGCPAWTGSPRSRDSENGRWTRKSC